MAKINWTTLKEMEERAAQPTDLEVLGQVLTEQEIENIIQGQLLTDLELKIFELGVTY